MHLSSYFYIFVTLLYLLYYTFNKLSLERKTRLLGFNLILNFITLFFHLAAKNTFMIISVLFFICWHIGLIAYFEYKKKINKEQ